MGCSPTSPAIEEDTNEEGILITLYFSDANQTSLLPEKRRVKAEDKDLLPKMILEELLKGPQNEELISSVPKGTRLLGLEIDKGKIIVNLSREVIDNFNAGAMGEGYLIFSIVNSLTELPKINKVQILVEGNIVESIGGHILLEEPFERAEDLIL